MILIRALSKQVLSSVQVLTIDFVSFVGLCVLCSNHVLAIFRLLAHGHTYREINNHTKQMEALTTTAKSSSRTSKSTSTRNLVVPKPFCTAKGFMMKLLLKAHNEPNGMLDRSVRQPVWIG